MPFARRMTQKVGTAKEALDDLAQKIAVAREAQSPDVHGRAQAAIDIIPKVRQAFDAHSGVFRTELIHAPNWISVSVLRATNTVVPVVQLKAEDGTVFMQKKHAAIVEWRPIPLTYDPVACRFSDGVDAVMLATVVAIAEWFNVGKQ